MGAHPNDTWCIERSQQTGKRHKDGNQSQPLAADAYVNWLEEETMLPTLVPKARIMRYGYRSDGFGRDRVRTRGSHISERLIFNLKMKREVIGTSYLPRNTAFLD